MARKFLTMQAHVGEDHLNPDWNWEYILKYLIQIQLKLGFPVVSLSIGSAQAPTWAYGNKKLWKGEYPGLSDADKALFKQYLKLGGGLMYYEAPYNTINPWYPGLPDAGRTFEDYINASCDRMTKPFNPLTGKYDDDLEEMPFGIDIVNQIFGDLGDDGKIKAIIAGHQFCTSWASYLCGVERYEYGAACPLGPTKMGDRWLEIYQNQFEETPFCWLAGLQCQITYPYWTNNAICQTHLFKADQKPRNWRTKTSQEDAEFNVDWLLNSEELADVRALSFIMIKEKFYKDGPLDPIFAAKDKDWRHHSIPGQITPYTPRNLPEAHLIDAMKGTDSQLYGLWKGYVLNMLNYLAGLRDNDDLIICSDVKTKDMVKQQYHESGIVISHQKILDIAGFLANLDNWKVDQPENYGGTLNVTRPPDWVKLTYDSENEFYTLAEAWWILFYAIFVLAKHEEWTTIPSIALRPVIGPCEPSICNKTYGNGLPTEDSVFSLNVWWQHNGYASKYVTFAELKSVAFGLFPTAKTNKKVGPTHFSDRKVFLPKVLWCCNLNDSNGDPISANAAEFLYILAKMLVNWSANPTAPANVHFQPSHVLPKLYPIFCLYNDDLRNPFQTDIEGQLNWLEIGQRWTLKPAVLELEYR